MAAASNNDRIIKYQTQIYCISVGAIVLKALLSFSDLLQGVPGIVHSLLGAVFIAGLLYKIMVYQTYNKTNLIVIAAWGMACMITYSKAHYYYLICSYLCIIAAWNVDFKQVTKMLYKMKALYLSVHILFYLIAYYTNREMINFSYRAGDRSRPRHYFFVSHANTFTMLLTWTTLEYLYSEYERLSYKKIAAVWFVNVFFYLFTDSNTGILVSTITVLCLVGIKAKNRIGEKFVNWGAKYLFLLFSILFPAMMVVFPKLTGAARELWLAVNDMFTGRLLYGACAYDMAGWTLFGKVMELSGKIYWQGFWFDGMGCDNTYVWMFVCYGYIQLLIIAAALMILSKKASVQDKIFIIAYAIYGVMEAYIINATFCFPLMLIGKYLFLTERAKFGKRNLSNCGE